MQLRELLAVLDYEQSPYYVQTDAVHQHAPEVATLLRAARRANVHGVYLFRTSPDDRILAPKPAVFVAEAQTEDEARDIHQSLWNLGHAPFLIVLLPSHVRVYTGFDYSKTSARRGLVMGPIPIDGQLRNKLVDFNASAIDVGVLWEKWATFLKSDRRVDRRLLKSLRDLSSILRREEGLPPTLAHALIGKYVYIRYLKDREILSDEWLADEHIVLDTVLGRNATVSGLRQLSEVLDKRFNGEIFPIDFGATQLRNEHVALVAAVFAGDQPLMASSRQLHLEFKAYDFQYIPIELLSSIYEQFIQAKGESRTIGAFYTPEHLADYVLSEVQTVKPLRRGMRVLDPSCGSGIFLVFAYRRLIELELNERSTQRLEPEELASILLESVFGVERENEACYVAEFSLLLTLLDYVEPPDLKKNASFKFPALRNRCIFKSDFFDEESLFWQCKLSFDWIVGNPPWIELQPKMKDEDHVRKWIYAHTDNAPVAGGRVAEAFSWRVSDALAASGVVGLVLPAKTLFNHESRKYRKAFFQKHEVSKVTNFSNLRNVLFDGKVKAPAFTVVYCKGSMNQDKRGIVHYGPFLVNQTTFVGREIWAMTINEAEIQIVSPSDAATGNAIIWKFALWGTYRDRQAVAWLQQLYPLTLGRFCNEMLGWHLREGSQLRNVTLVNEADVKHVPALEGKQEVDIDTINSIGTKFSIPGEALKDIPPDRCYVRIKGGEAGLKLTQAPHVLIPDTWNYVIYSEQDFVIPPRQIGIAAPAVDADYLRALSVYLSTSVIRYYLFFHTPAWGIERNVITLKDAKGIPIPRLTSTQVERLVMLHKELVQNELAGEMSDLQTRLDRGVAEIVGIPDEISLLAEEFFRVRLPLNSGGGTSAAMKRPRAEDLQLYGLEIASELDSFVEGSDTYHKVALFTSNTRIVCVVEISNSQEAFPVIVKMDDDTEPHIGDFPYNLKERFSQWVYVQRGLRIFDGPRAYIFKTPRLLDWTRTKALNDADDIIAEILAAAENNA